MKQFNSKLAASVLVGLGAVYLVLSLATGRSARADVPPDLAPRPADTMLDVWKAATLMVAEPRTAVLDVRPADAFARYHLPRAVSVPGAKPQDVTNVLRSAPAVVVYAGKDDVAQKLVSEVKTEAPTARVYYLADGARAWYLAFQLPVPLFAENAPPSSYVEAIQAVSGWFGGSSSAPQPKVMEALQTLAKVDYQPTLLKSGKKPAAASGGAKKKIGGGCG